MKNVLFYFIEVKTNNLNVIIQCQHTSFRDDVVAIPNTKVQRCNMYNVKLGCKFHFLRYYTLFSPEWNVLWRRNPMKYY